MLGFSGPFGPGWKVGTNDWFGSSVGAGFGLGTVGSAVPIAGAVCSAGSETPLLGAAVWPGANGAVVTMAGAAGVACPSDGEN